ncbi:MAG: peptide chain release factor N(5)-glutamine methyltransferase, partial [Bacteroidales bacterium]|nr:peptide chain release factor N(5)-glutamine methyltransferase [Bacteroidales bacterium]
MTYREFIDSAVSRLAPLYPADEARAAATSLLCRILNIQPYKCIAEPGTSVGSGEEALEEALSQIEEGRPLQYVLGFTEFCGLRIRVREGVLIPRPETEEMVSMIVDDLTAPGAPFDENAPVSGDGPIFNILDMCTGSGCIAYALADAFPEAQVFGCDLSDDALSVACRQRVKLQGARPVFFRADVLGDPPAGLPKFDLIVSNPPYVLESEKAQMRRNVL